MPWQVPNSLLTIWRKIAATRLWRTTAATVNTYSEIDGEQRAASFAYYVFFSIFPLVALLITVGSLYFSSEEIIDMIQGFLPMGPTQQEFIWKTVHTIETIRGGVGIISVIILLWSSLKFFQALIHGVNRAWHTVEIPWWQMPLKNLLMLLILGSALIAGLLVPALLQGANNTLLAAESFMRLRFPTFNLHLISGLLDLSRYFLGAVVLFYSFVMLYMFAPARKVKFSEIWLASLIVTVALQMCQIGFVNYLPRFVNYSVYGAVGVIMLLLLWVYVSGIIIIFGACLCAARVRIEEADHPAPDVEHLPLADE